MAKETTSVEKFEPKIIAFLCNWCSYVSRFGRGQQGAVSSQYAKHQGDVYGDHIPSPYLEGLPERGRRGHCCRLPYGRLPLLKRELPDHKASGHIEGTPEIHGFSRGTVILGLDFGSRRDEICRTCQHLYTKNKGAGPVTPEDLLLIVNPGKRER